MQPRLVQAAVRKLVKRIYFRSAKERVPQMWCVDDGAFITAVVDDQAASVAAAHVMDRCWMVTRACGLKVMVTGIKKSRPAIGNRAGEQSTMAMGSDTAVQL